jgi:serine/threonine protein kinase
MSTTMNEGFVEVQTIQEKYSFKKKLGQGGYCDVFLAEHKETGKKVAVKMMEMVPGSEKVSRRVDRFRREMFLYGQLDHPNIVSVIDSGETETGVLFIAFEYIAGQTLAQLLKKEGMLSISRTITIMKQILVGLQAAHDKGIIHRDLKPENIMIVGKGDLEQAKILDFGISTFIAGQCTDLSRLTATKEFLGTPIYAAPEQLRGEPITQKVDIFSWSLMFLECITGKLPFSGNSVASIVQQQLSPAPVPIPAVLSDHRLGTLLHWTLEKEAQRRAGSCAIIAAHLESIPVSSIFQQNGFLTNIAASGEPIQSADVAIYETYIAAQERRQVTVVCF